MTGEYTNLKSKSLEYINQTLNGMLQYFQQSKFKVIDPVRGRESPTGFLGNCIFLSGILQALAILTQEKYPFVISGHKQRINSLISETVEEMSPAIKKFNSNNLNSLPYFNISKHLAKPKSYFIESISWGLSVVTLTRFFNINYKNVLKLSKTTNSLVTECLIDGIQLIKRYQNKDGWGWTKRAEPDIYYTYSVLSTLDDIAEYFLKETESFQLGRTKKKDKELLTLYLQKTRNDLIQDLDDMRSKASKFILKENKYLEMPIYREADNDMIQDLYKRFYTLNSVYYSGADIAKYSDEESERRRRFFVKKLNDILTFLAEKSNSKEHQSLLNNSDYPLTVCDIPEIEFIFGEAEKNFSLNVNDPSLISLIVNVSSYWNSVLKTDIMRKNIRELLIDLLLRNSTESDGIRSWKYTSGELNPWRTTCSVESLIAVVDMMNEMLEREGEKTEKEYFDLKNPTPDQLSEIYSNKKIREFFIGQIVTGITQSLEEPGSNKPKTADKKKISNLLTAYQASSLFEDLQEKSKFKGEDKDYKIKDQEIKTCYESLEKFIIDIISQNLKIIIAKVIISNMAPESDEAKTERNKELAKQIGKEFSDGVVAYMTHKERNIETTVPQMISKLFDTLPRA